VTQAGTARPRRSGPYMGTLPELTEETLHALLSSGSQAWVVFTARWCSFGLLLSARLAGLAPRPGDGWTVGWFDAGRAPEPARELGVHRIPALALIEGSRVVRRWYGADVEIEECLARAHGR